MMLKICSSSFSLRQLNLSSIFRIPSDSYLYSRSSYQVTWLCLIFLNDQVQSDIFNSRVLPWAQNNIFNCNTFLSGDLGVIFESATLLSYDFLQSLTSTYFSNQITCIYLHCCCSGWTHQYLWNLLFQFLVLFLMSSVIAFSRQYTLVSVKILGCVTPLLQCMLSLSFTLTKFKLPYHSFT